MTIQSDNLLTLRSMKAQLEVGLIYLRRRHGELQRQLSTAESQERRGTIHPDALAQLQNTVQDHAVQIERRNLEIREIEERIRALQRQTERGGATNLLSEHDQVTAEIAAIRNQVLSALRELAGPLHRYEQLAEQKNRLVDEIAVRTGRNQAYVNYIESALFRQNEYVDDVRYVVEALKRQRVVA